MPDPSTSDPSTSTPLAQSTGRRKEAVARVRLRQGEGNVTVNNHPLEEYFPSLTHRMLIKQPLVVTDTLTAYDIDANIEGGGVTGQAGALRLGIARGLIFINPDLKVSLRRSGLLTRDSRVKEAKKYGLKKARKAPQYSKR
ncbi:MAG: 30S ribosomal protein S9 [Actinobacteria bacterium]|nr:30S ribosomal protein S9 [Actinomycetota bacterium]MCL6105369.1 30S ribosomal protein S9 [Actinomycetota bacterium]